MKITRMNWTNFKGLVDGEIVADGCDVIVSGRNGAGKSSIAQVVPFVLYGKINGSIKRYEEGLTPTNDGLIHGAEIIFDDGTSLRREYFWTSQGNRQNLYINGGLVKLTRFKAEIEKLTNNGGEFVINPFAFSALPSKEQRDFLGKIFGAISDREILNMPEFEKTAEIFDGLTAECFIARTKIELKNPRTESASIPARIAELEYQIIDLPENILEETRRLETELSIKRGEQEKISVGMSEALKKISAELASKKEERIKLSAGEIERTAAKKRVAELERQKTFHTRALNQAQTRRADLLAEYHELTSATAGKCPTCGQVIPLEQFEAKRDEKLMVIVDEGKRCKAEIAENEKILADIDAELKTLQTQAQSQPDERLAKLDAEIRELETKLESQQTQEENQRRELFSKLNGEIGELERKLAKLKSATEIKGRIEKLRAREKELNRQITELEGHLALAEKFQQQKIELVETQINGKFEHVRFKLFDYLITTGEVKPTCEATLGGVPFNALSKGEKLKAALDIFKSLQRHFGTELPLIIDDAESYTSNSFVELPNQIFLFRVSDAEKLSINVDKARRAA